MRKVIPACIGVVILAFLIMQGCAREGISSLLESRSKSDYRVVLMDSGQVFFGRLDKRVEGYIVLKDVHYLPRFVDRKDGYVEVERFKDQFSGSTRYLPEAIYLDPGQVMLMEPLSRDSKVVGLIERGQENRGG